MNVIQKCRTREILDCCYVTEDNIDEFFKIAEPHMKERHGYVERGKYWYTVHYEKHKVLYRLNSWYVFDWTDGRYIKKDNFDEYFEIVDDETRV